MALAAVTTPSRTAAMPSRSSSSYTRRASVAELAGAVDVDGVGEAELLVELGLVDAEHDPVDARGELVEPVGADALVDRLAARRGQVDRGARRRGRT
jgi:hypothetical protein